MSDFVKIPGDYNPGISVEKWKELIKDSAVFNDDDLEYVKRICDYNAPFFAGDLSLKYGMDPNTYSRPALWKKIIDECHITLPEQYKDAYYAVMLYKDSDSPNRARYMVRDEVLQAVEESDLSSVRLYSASVVLYKVDEKYDELVKNGTYPFVRSRDSRFQGAPYNDGLDYFVKNPLCALVVIQCGNKKYLGNWVDQEITKSVDLPGEVFGRKFHIIDCVTNDEKAVGYFHRVVDLQKKNKDPRKEQIRLGIVTNVESITKHSSLELIEIIDKKIVGDHEEKQLSGIHIPMFPQSIVLVDGDYDVICGKCESIFRKAKRCTYCGQLLRWPSDDELNQYIKK